MGLSTEEQAILESIHVASENDPNNPEFPPEDPQFPATPTVQINVPGFSNVWLKDESHNPTGTHKDRMAWEIIVTYRNFLLAKKQGLTDKPLPSFSIISSGSAATAIQNRLRQYNLPALRVIVDHTTDPLITEHLQKIGCKLFRTDLSQRLLQWNDILKITENERGFDITSSEALDPTTRFYDWLSYEILNNNPEWCFVPFGTGNLYENILNIAKKEILAEKHDPRFRGDTKIWRQCNYIGATTSNPSSKATKLYSPHLPFVHYDEQWIRFYQTSGYCGPHSEVKQVDEECLEEAIRILIENGVHAEASAAASLAMLLQMRSQVPPDAKIVIVSTGCTKME